MMSNCSPCSCSCTPCCCQPFYGGPSTTTTTRDPNIPTTTTTTVCEEVIPAECIIYNYTFLEEYGVNPGDSLADILNLIAQFLCICQTTTTTTLDPDGCYCYQISNNSNIDISPVYDLCNPNDPIIGAIVAPGETLKVCSTPQSFVPVSGPCIETVVLGDCDACTTSTTSTSTTSTTSTSTSTTSTTSTSTTSSTTTTTTIPPTSTTTSTSTTSTSTTSTSTTSTSTTSSTTSTTSSSTTTTSSSTTTTTTEAPTCTIFTLDGGVSGRTFTYTRCGHTSTLDHVVAAGDQVEDCIKLPYSATGATNTGVGCSASDLASLVWTVSGPAGGGLTIEQPLFAYYVNQNSDNTVNNGAIQVDAGTFVSIGIAGFSPGSIVKIRICDLNTSTEIFYNTITGTNSAIQNLIMSAGDLWSVDVVVGGSEPGSC